MAETIRLFGFWRSQAAYRVRIALALKNLDWEETSVNLLAGEQFDGGFAARNPQNAVPILIDGGPPLTQSLAIIEYLEERYPQPALYPQDPYERAAARSFSLITIADSHPFTVPRVRKQLGARFEATDADMTSWIQHWQEQALQAMEERLATRQRDANFCFGDQPGIADIGLASHVSSAMMNDTPTDTYAHVTAVYERCLELEAFALHSPQALIPDGVG